MPDGSVKIVIPICPITKKNHQQIAKRYTANGKETRFVVPSEPYKKYEREAAWFVRNLAIDYPVNIEAHFYMKTKKRVDLSNLNEALHDVLVKAGCLVDDNATIIVSSDGSRVFYDKENPRTEVWITKTDPTFLVK